MRPGRRLAVDVGLARIGLAISDQSSILSSPLATVARAQTLDESCDLILAEVAEFEIVEIYVGLPVGLSGNETNSTKDALALAVGLSSKVNCQVRLIDERMTTVSATANLREHGISAKKQRKIIDQEAAALILENALNQERVQGTPPGRSIEEL